MHHSRLKPELKKGEEWSLRGTRGLGLRKKRRIQDNGEKMPTENKKHDVGGSQTAKQVELKIRVREKLQIQDKHPES